jgi:hypothetical protein
MSVTINNPYTGNPTQVTVYAGGGHSVHDYAPSVVNYVESAIGVLVNIAAIYFQQPEFYWAAAAVDAAEAGQDFSNGEDLQGILSVAQALSAGITAGAGGTVGGVAPPVSAQVINVASEAVGGVYGIVQSAENGNGAGILAGALEDAAAAAAGIGIYQGGNAQQTLNLVSTALGAASVATNMGEDFANGNLGQGLVDSLNLYLPAVALAKAAFQSNQLFIDSGDLSQGEISFLNGANGQSSNLVAGIGLSPGETALIDQVDNGLAQINGSTLQAPVLMAFLTGGGLGDLAGKIWNLPNTAIGLVVGSFEYGAGLIAGTDPSITFGNNAIQFQGAPFGSSGGGAITFGNVEIFHDATPSDFFPTYSNPNLFVQVGPHEEGHTYQSQALGPFFFPGYFLYGGISKTNPFENSADNYGRGVGGPFSAFH